MGILIDTIKNNLKSQDITKYYKENTLSFYNQYQNPDNINIKAININSMIEGHFYFIMAKDSSNWMQYTPIFYIDWKKFDGMVIVYGINFNFIPLQIRAAFFDRFCKDLDDERQFEGVDFQKAYTELIRYGYEYAITEWSTVNLKRVYQISIKLLPQFLYSGFPTNKYDPNKLYSIWEKKLETREQRHQEMIKSTLDDFLNINKDIEGQYDLLSNRIDRIQKNL